VGFRRHANKALEALEFEHVDPLYAPEVYALHSLRVVLFERRAQASRTNGDTLQKLHAVMASSKITTIERRRARPGVFEQVSKRIPNPLTGALVDIEDYYLQNAEEENGKPKLSLRASEIIDVTEDEYRENGTELALRIDENSGLSVLEAQRGILEDKARTLNAAKRLLRPDRQDGPLAIPFMRAPFDSDGQRDEFIDKLTAEEPIHLPVYGIDAGPVEWRLET